MTQPYGGPERRADARHINDLRDAVVDLSERVASMTEALENTSRQAQAAQDDAAYIRDQQIKDRRRTLIAGIFAGLMLIGLTVALIVSFVGLHREHEDFVDLRNQSFHNCQIRNAQAQNSIDFYKALGNILIEAQKQNPSPALQDAIDAFAKASRTVPPPADCRAVANVGAG